jgi:nitric oxide reductase NorQ protein
MTINDEIKTSIRDGNRLVDDIHTDVSEEETDQNGKTTRSPTRSYVNRKLNEMLEDGIVIREKDGRSWNYFIQDETERVSPATTGVAEPAPTADQSVEPSGQAALNDTATPVGEAGGQSGPTTPQRGGVPNAVNMPVNRDYDHSTEIPSGVPSYIPSGKELAKILATVNTREETGKLPRFLIGGPTGCGKTHLAQFIAQHREAPLYTIQGKWALNESHLLGRPVMVGDTSYWVDGPLVKALLASREGEVVLLLDELNRARPDSKGVLFPALDDRGRADLEMRGGEVIQGNPENIIVIATVNEGRNYYNEQMDLAEIRRVSTKHNVDYLGRAHPDREATLIADRTPASENLARMLVETANLVRVEADKTGTNVEIGIPTASVISWAQEAYAYSESDMPNPIVEAADATVIRPYFDADPQARSVVEETISGKFENLPFDEDGIAKKKGKDVQTVITEMEDERKSAERNA